MRRTRCLQVLCPFVLMVAAPPAMAQVADSLASTSSPRSALAAGALELFFPTLGHAYAGNRGRGLPPLLVFVAGIAVMMEGSDHCQAGERCGILFAGAATMVAGKAWGVYSAARLARSTRDGADVGLYWEPRAHGPGLRVTWHR
jgi:hypothetical protein